MGIGAVIHGFIECPGWSHNSNVKRLFRLNRKVLSSLPISDTDWPFITKDMFSMLPLRPSLERQVAQYENQVIHFAGDYKNMYILEADWITKFERLLARLYWHSAVVTNEFSALRYEWSIAPDRMGDMIDRDPPLPPTEWTFRCFKMTLNQLPLSEAVEGALNSPHHIADSSQRGD